MSAAVKGAPPLQAPSYTGSGMIPNVQSPSPYSAGQWSSPPPTMHFLPAQAQAGGQQIAAATASLSYSSPPTSPGSLSSWPPRLAAQQQPAVQPQYAVRGGGAAAPILVQPQGQPQAIAPYNARGAQAGQVRPYYEQEPKPLAVQVAEEALVNPRMREAMKRQALVVGGHAVDAAKYCGHRGAEVFQDYIQQGPQGVSVLCFVGGVATTILGAMGVCNFFGTVMDPFHYILNAYVFVFGLATALLEADTDRIGILMTPFNKLAEPVTRAQAWLHEECRLLTRLRGRGFFYLYQGTLLVTQCVFCLLFVCGLYLVAMGTICVLMSFGFTPDIEGMIQEAGVFGGPNYAGVSTEDGSSGHLVNPQVFKQAESSFKRHKEQLPGKACRELWALQKQATVGDCFEEMPEGVFNGSAKEQWRLWTKLAGIPQEEAKALFVQRLQKEGVLP